MVGPTRTARVTTQSLAVILCLMPGLGPQRGSDGRVQAQETIGSTEATVAGAAMGLYAGGALGGLASLVPCNQTMAGISCVRTVAVLGAGIGLASGVTLGREDSDAIWTAYRRAGFGFLAGSAVVLALKPFVDRWSWADVAAGGVIGSSVAVGRPLHGNARRDRCRPDRHGGRRLHLVDHPGRGRGRFSLVRPACAPV